MRSSHDGRRAASNLKTALWASAAIGLLAAPAMAQEAAAPVGGNTIEEIVITSQKGAVGQSLQRTPISVTAIDPETVARTQATTLIDVGRLAPNVQLQTAAAFPGIANFTIRGLSLNSSMRTLDPTVTVVVDGLPYGDPLATVLDTFDIESMEILRGPQGILIGRNATGGAVVIETKRPPTSFEAEATVRVGNYGRFDQTASVGGPLGDSGFRAKLAVAHRKSDGTNPDNNAGTLRPAPGNPSGTVPFNARADQLRENTWIVRPAIAYENGNFDATLIGEWIKSKTGGNNSRLLFARPVLTDQFGYTPPPFGYQVDHNGPDGYEMNTRRFSLVANWDIGPGVITSATGYRQVDVDGSSDNDGTPFSLFHFPDNTNDGDQFSQELRFASTFSDRFDILIGGYYSTLSLDSTEYRLINSVISSPALPYRPIYQYGEYTQDSKTAALFGNIDFHVTDRLTLSGGLRYTYEKKEFDISPIRACAGPGPTNCPSTRAQDDVSFEDLSPRVAVNYRVTEDVLAYASYTEGFRSGNYNGRATSLLGATPSEPEDAASFEAGLKTTFWDRKARLNIAAYRTSYDNIQKVLTASDGVQRILNVAQAGIHGAEFELTLRPFGGLQIDAIGGWTHARYKEFNGLDLTGDGIPDPELAKRLRFERVPEYQFTLAGSYMFDLGSAGDLTVRTSYAWVDKMAVEVTNVAALEVPEHGIWDAGVTWEPNDRLRLTAYGKNLSNTKYWDIGVNYAWGPTVSGGEARTYGLELGYKF